MSKTANGICNVHYSKITYNDKGVATFATPVAIPGLKNMDATDTYTEGSEYADNREEIHEATPNGADIMMEFLSLSRKIEAELCGRSYKAGGMSVKTTDVQNDVAILYQRNYTDKSFENIVYYNCSLKRDNDSGSTKTESASYTGATLSGRAKPLENGLIKFVIASDEIENDEAMKTKLENFFKAVQFEEDPTE